MSVGISQNNNNYRIENKNGEVVYQMGEVNYIFEVKWFERSEGCQYVGCEIT